MLIFSIVLAGAADVPQPVSYTDGLVTAELAVDEVIDLYYHGGSYDSFHVFSREVDGRNAVFLYFDRTLRSVSYTHLDVYKRQGLAFVWRLVQAQARHIR